MDRDTEQAPNEWKHCKHENLQEAAYKLETKCDVYLNQLISCYSTYLFYKSNLVAPFTWVLLFKFV